MKIFLNDSSQTGLVTRVFLFLCVLSFIFLSSCSRNVVKDEKDFKVADDENIALLLTSLEKFNLNSPKSLYAEFNTEGQSLKKKFKASGIVQFHNNPVLMRLVFHDAVFKSPITEIVRNEDIIKFYFPFENVLYIDNEKTIDLKFYSNIDIDFKLISDLTLFKIPVIRDFSVRKGLEGGNSESGKNKLLLLENNDYYETISFINEIPDKILWLNKRSKEKIEVYFKEPVFYGDTTLYKNIRIVSLNSDLKIDIYFSSIKLNIPLDLEKMIQIKLPSNGKVVRKVSK